MVAREEAGLGAGPPICGCPPWPEAALAGAEVASVGPDSERSGGQGSGAGSGRVAWRASKAVGRRLCLPSPQAPAVSRARRGGGAGPPHPRATAAVARWPGRPAQPRPCAPAGLSRACVPAPLSRAALPAARATRGAAGLPPAPRRHPEDSAAAGPVLPRRTGVQPAPAPPPSAPSPPSPQSCPRPGCSGRPPCPRRAGAARADILGE